MWAASSCFVDAGCYFDGKLKKPSLLPARLPATKKFHSCSCLLESLLLREKGFVSLGEEAKSCWNEMDCSTGRAETTLLRRGGAAAVLPSSQLLADGRLTSVFVGGKLQDRFLTISCIHIDMLA